LIISLPIKQSITEIPAHSSQKGYDYKNTHQMLVKMWEKGDIFHILGGNVN
jgi:hypothetical protein